MMMTTYDEDDDNYDVNYDDNDRNDAVDVVIVQFVCERFATSVNKVMDCLAVCGVPNGHRFSPFAGRVSISP